MRIVIIKVLTGILTTIIVFGLWSIAIWLEEKMTVDTPVYYLTHYWAYAVSIIMGIVAAIIVPVYSSKKTKDSDKDGVVIQGQKYRLEEDDE